MGVKFSPFDKQEDVTMLLSILTCREWVVGSSGYLDVQYTKGGQPVILTPTNALNGSGFCGNAPSAQLTGSANRQDSAAKSSLDLLRIAAAVPMALILHWVITF